jgi:hypothetical protein
LPHASVTFGGAVNKSSKGQLCFGLVVDNLTVNGTANVFANDTQCASAGWHFRKEAGGVRSSIEPARCG